MLRRRHTAAAATKATHTSMQLLKLLHAHAVCCLLCARTPLLLLLVVGVWQSERWRGVHACSCHAASSWLCCPCCSMLLQHQHQHQPLCLSLCARARRDRHSPLCRAYICGASSLHQWQERTSLQPGVCMITARTSRDTTRKAQGSSRGEQSTNFATRAMPDLQSAVRVCFVKRPAVPFTHSKHTFVASCFLGALPPVLLRAVCLVRAMILFVPLGVCVCLCVLR